MRTVSTVLALVLFGPASGAEPPRYTVESKLPKYTVVNRVPAVVVKSSQTDADRYSYLVQSVIEGRAFVMIVGPHPYLEEYIAQEKFPSGFMGFADGVYDCYRDDGKAVMKLRTAPAREVRQNPFPSSTDTTEAIPAPSVAVVPMSYPAGAGRTRATTPVRWVIRGGTTTANCTVG